MDSRTFLTPRVLLNWIWKILRGSIFTDSNQSRNDYETKTTKDWTNREPISLDFSKTFYARFKMSRFGEWGTHLDRMLTKSWTKCCRILIPNLPYPWASCWFSLVYVDLHVERWCCFLPGRTFHVTRDRLLSHVAAVVILQQATRNSFSSLLVMTFKLPKIEFWIIWF